MKPVFLFDLDGTLANTGEGILACARYALEAFGITESDRELRKFVGPPLKTAFSEFYGFAGEDLALAVKRYRTHYREVGVYLSPLYPGIPEMLEQVAPWGVLCLATSKPQPFAEQILEMRGIRPWFQVVVGCHMDGTRSRKAEVIEEALRQAGDPDRSRVLMIGDRKQDVLGAAEAGLRTLGVTYGYAEPGELETAGAAALADTPAQAAEICVRWSRGGVL